MYRRTLFLIAVLAVLVQLVLFSIWFNPYVDTPRVPAYPSYSVSALHSMGMCGGLVLDSARRQLYGICRTDRDAFPDIRAYDLVSNTVRTVVTKDECVFPRNLQIERNGVGMFVGCTCSGHYWFSQPNMSTLLRIDLASSRVQTILQLYQFTVESIAADRIDDALYINVAGQKAGRVMVMNTTTGGLQQFFRNDPELFFNDSTLISWPYTISAVAGLLFMTNYNSHHGPILSVRTTTTNNPVPMASYITTLLDDPTWCYIVNRLEFDSDSQLLYVACSSDRIDGPPRQEGHAGGVIAIDVRSGSLRTLLRCNYSNILALDRESGGVWTNCDRDILRITRTLEVHRFKATRTGCSYPLTIVPTQKDPTVLAYVSCAAQSVIALEGDVPA